MIELLYRSVVVASNVKAVEKEGGWWVDAPSSMPVGTELRMRDSAASSDAGKERVVRVARATEVPSQMWLRPAEVVEIDAISEQSEPFYDRRPKGKGKRK